jgi:DNA (cytosine-5)-methyltransferase 1
MKQTDYTYIDLFAGCGGLSLGLHNAGWKGLFAVEKSPDAFKTLEHNLIIKKNHFEWPEWLGRPSHLEIDAVIKKYRSNLIGLRGKVDMITGGPPCQGFSTAGKRNEEDKRNKLINSYIKFVEFVQPKILFFENVKGFTMEFDKNRSKGKKYSDYVTKKLDKLGYDVYPKLVNFSEYGVPQKRCRFILVGVRKEICKQKGLKAKRFFELIDNNKEEFLVNKKLEINVSLEHAISDLLMSNGTEQSPDVARFQAGIYNQASSKYQTFLRGDTMSGAIADSHRFAKHSPEIKERFRLILKYAEKGKSISEEIKERFEIKKRTVIPLDPKDQAPTITTLPDDYIHYAEPRILTVREYARIQSFPDYYEFQGKYTTGGKRRTQEVPRYSQIGNAIPPLFGEQSGLVLKQLIS